MHAHEVDLVARRSIAADHKNRVLVGFVVRERSRLVTRDHPFVIVPFIGINLALAAAAMSSWVADRIVDLCDEILAGWIYWNARDKKIRKSSFATIGGYNWRERI
jgi:hypothetical protein